MFTSLRARLWLTYAIIILLILSILGLGIFVYLIRNPVIDRRAIQKLDVSLTIIRRQVNEGSLSLRESQEYLNRISESLSIRLMLFSPERKLILDTEPQEPIIQWPISDLSPPKQGRINDQDGDTWLYSSWLSVESTVGVGSIFEVVIPVVKHDASTVSVQPEELNRS
ncbi:MAG: hypothetical protein V3V66_00990 [Anaerolineales bacterium]